MTNKTKRNLTAREVSTILAALRYWQGQSLGVHSRHMCEIIDLYGLEHGLCDDDEIDELCESLNCGKVTLTEPAASVRVLAPVVTPF